MPAFAGFATVEAPALSPEARDFAQLTAVAVRIVEIGEKRALFSTPRHPYTRALIACDPATAEQGKGPLPTIPGRLPDPSEPIAGCGFASRCSLASERCRETPPPAVTVAKGHVVRCHEVTP